MSHFAITRALGLTLAATVTLSLAACGRDTDPVLPKPVAATAAVAVAPPTAAGTTPDTSVPDASRTFADQDAAERAKASQGTAAALNQSGPPNTMSEAQESKAMPLAGQANDHSTPAREGKPKVPPTN